MSRRFFGFVLGSVFFFLAALYLWNFHFKPQLIAHFISKAPPPVYTISTEPVKREVRFPKISATGTLRAILGVEIKSQVSGVVREIHFQEGGEVQKGDLLVVLDDAIEQAQLASARASLKNAEREFLRQDGLTARGVASKSQYDLALAERDRALAAVQQVEAVIAQKRIVAPFSGRLGIKQVTVGQYISPGSVFVPLYALGELFVDFSIPESDVSKLKIGQNLKVRVDAYPDKVFPAQVETINVNLNEETRTLQVRGRLKNVNRLLFPGMFAQIDVFFDREREVLTLPLTAVTYSLYGDSVFVVHAGHGTEKSTVERRFVKTGGAENGRVVFLEGLKEGEVVATAGQQKLSPNAFVSVNNGSPLIQSQEKPLQ